MNKRILTSAVALASFSALTIPTVASADYTYRVPIYQTDIDRNYDSDTDPGPGPGPGDPGPSDPTEPNYCDINSDIDQMWLDSFSWSYSHFYNNIVTRDDDNNRIYNNPEIIFGFTSGGGGVTQSMASINQYPSKCFENIVITSGSGANNLNFLNGAESGSSIIVKDYTDNITDISSLKYIKELNVLDYELDYFDLGNTLEDGVKIPENAWLCQPSQADIFINASQKELCEMPPLPPWEQYATDLGKNGGLTNETLVFDYSNWNIISWDASNTGNSEYHTLKGDLPDENYPVDNPSKIEFLGNFDFTSIDGLGSISSVDDLIIENRELTDLSNFNFVVNNEIYLIPGIQDNTGFKHIPASAYLCQPENNNLFTGAIQSDVCEISFMDNASFSIHRGNYLGVGAPYIGGGVGSNLIFMSFDYENIDLNREIDLSISVNNDVLNTSEKISDIDNDISVDFSPVSYNSFFPVEVTATAYDIEGGSYTDNITLNNEPFLSLGYGNNNYGECNYNNLANEFDYCSFNPVFKNLDLNQPIEYVVTRDGFTVDTDIPNNGHYGKIYLKQNSDIDYITNGVLNSSSGLFGTITVDVSDSFDGTLYFAMRGVDKDGNTIEWSDGRLSPDYNWANHDVVNN